MNAKISETGVESKQSDHLCLGQCDNKNYVTLL